MYKATTYYKVKLKCPVTRPSYSSILSYFNPVRMNPASVACCSFAFQDSNIILEDQQIIGSTLELTD